MRRITVLGFLLLLSGCNGFDGFLDDTFSLHGDPNRPVTTAENVERANGGQPTSTPIAVQAGNVWPGPIKPLPSLADIAKTLPEAEGVPVLPAVPPNPAMPPRSSVPIYTAPPSTVAPPPSSSPSAQNAPTLPRGTTIHTSRGPEVVSGGTGNFLTLTSPDGQYAGIMVPNGNGTSTIIRPDGSVETVPAPH
jgi:hypothetical protein